MCRSPQFINKLSQSKLLRDVNLLVSEEFVQNSEKMRRFQIDMTLNPNADVQTTPKPVRTAAVELETH